MRRLIGFVTLAIVASACSPTAGESNPAGDDKDKEKSKGVIVDIDGLKSAAPSDWKQEKPSSSMRWLQFRLPKKDDDIVDAELYLFKGSGGGAKANVERWKGQFDPPEGKTIDEASEVKEIRLGDRPASYIDVRGTYKPLALRPGAKAEKKPNYRMLAIYYDGPKDVYQIKLTGPAKTVEAYKKGFDEWVKNFK